MSNRHEIGHSRHRPPSSSDRADGVNDRSDQGVMWWVRIDEALPARWRTDIEAVATAVNSRASAHARRLGREPEVVRVRLGDRVPLAEANLAKVFTRLSRNGPLAHAMLVVERVSSRWTCPGCRKAQTLLTSCDCKLPVQLLAGEEMVLDSMQG